MTVIQILHNKTITDERMANLAIAETDLIHFARSPFKDSAMRCSPSTRTLSGASSKQCPSSRGSPSNVLPTPTRNDLPRRSTIHPSSTTPSPTWCLRRTKRSSTSTYPSRTVLTSSSAKNHCPPPTASSLSVSALRSLQVSQKDCTDFKAFDMTSCIDTSALHDAVLSYGVGIIKCLEPFNETASSPRSHRNDPPPRSSSSTRSNHTH